MAGYYVYLMSSLPMLRFGMKLPFSFERFLGMCADLIDEEDLGILKSLSSWQYYAYEGTQATLKRLRSFDIALRDELVKIRAARKHLDAGKYLRHDGESGITLNHIAINAYRNPSILEAERMLDEARWRALDEMALGHYFDIDALLVYGIKLLILERWQRISTADKPQLLEETLAKS